MSELMPTGAPFATRLRLGRRGPESYAQRGVSHLRSLESRSP